MSENKRALPSPLLPSLLWGLGLMLAATVSHGSATSLERKTIVRLNQLRAVRANGSAAENKAYNRQMDAAWKFFESNKPKVLPILRSQLKGELAREQPSDLVLLDIGFFLHENEDAEGKALAFDALFRLNPDAPIVRANLEELFHFAAAAAQEHDPRVLGLIDRAFLSSDQLVIVPEHALELDGTLMCVFLYGAFGPESESALTGRLKDKAVARRVLEILTWLGSPASLPEVRDVLTATPDYEALVRGTKYLVRAAGPEGKDVLLTLPTAQLDAKSREFLGKMQAEFRDDSVESYREMFAEVPGDQKLSEAEVQARLDAMLANFGKDDRTSPLAVLNSGLGSEYLIAELTKVRSRILHRLSDEALADVEITNLLINGLRYRLQSESRQAQVEAGTFRAEWGLAESKQWLLRRMATRAAH